MNFSKRLFHRHQLTKQKAEESFWSLELDRYIAWYNGELTELFGTSAPTKAQKVVAQNTKDAAILTWYNLHQQPKYPADLQLPPTAFRNMKVLDIGAGPIPSALAFKDIELFCLDQLYSEYLALGYPLHYYDNVKFVNAPAEDIPLSDDFFDAVISINAIDHVDDLHRTAQEIKRVLKPGGKFAMHVHYHAATPTEPLEINDDIFTAEFGWCKGLKKISSSSQKTGSSAAANESYNIWRNF